MSVFWVQAAVTAGTTLMVLAVLELVSAALRYRARGRS